MRQKSFEEINRELKELREHEENFVSRMKREAVREGIFAQSMRANQLLISAALDGGATMVVGPTTIEITATNGCFGRPGKVTFQNTPGRGQGTYTLSETECLKLSERIRLEADQAISNLF